jgi:hypothetical protein
MAKTAKKAATNGRKTRKPRTQSPKATSLKYRDLLLSSTEDKEQEDLKYVVREKELQLEADLSKTEKSLLAKRRERTNLLSSQALDFVKLSAIDDEIEGLERGLARLESYRSLF